MQTPMAIKATTATDSGSVQRVNGDTLGVREPSTAIERIEQGWIWVIADGVGQGEAGVAARRLAASTVVDAYWASAMMDTSSRLRAAVEHANSVLYEQNQTDAQSGTAQPGNVGATIIAAVVVNGRLFLAHVGRSRAYLYSGNELVQLTEDHSWVARQIRLGLLTPAEAVNHPRQNVITRGLGVGQTVKVDCIERELNRSDVILLCSDGLYRELDEQRITAILRRLGADAAPALVDEAKQSGATDNVTAVTLSGVAAPIRQLPTVERMASIGRLSRELSASLDLTETLESVLRQLLNISGGNRAAILLKDVNGRLVPSIEHNMDPLGDVYSDTVAEKAVSECRAILVENTFDDPRFNRADSIVDMAIRSVLCVPMIVKDEVIGVLYVDSSTSTVRFSQSDLDLLTSFASHAATAIQNARLHDEVLAQTHEIEDVRRRQDAIIRSLSSALIAVDESGIVTDWNPMAAEIMGRPAEETIGSPLSAAVPAELGVWLSSLAQQVRFGNQTILTSHQWEGSIGERPRVVLAGRVARIRDTDEQLQGVVFVVNDRTDLVIMEEARQAEAAEQERLRDLFTRYLAPTVAEQLLRDHDALQLGGARKEVTILFADVRGFTGFSEQHEPEQVVAMLNRYLTLASSEIFEQLGTLDKFLGDGVMAIFGAPLPLQDHALAAVRAALAMRSQIDELRTETGARVGFGIGLNSGPAIVGNIGSSRYMNYTAIGDVVNVSARLQAEARAGEILISESTLQLVADRVQVEELGSLYVKGRSVPVATYKVLHVND